MNEMRITVKELAEKLDCDTSELTEHFKTTEEEVQKWFTEGLSLADSRPVVSFICAKYRRREKKRKKALKDKAIKRTDTTLERTGETPYPTRVPNVVIKKKEEDI